MAKGFLVDPRKLKKISTIAKAYKDGVSSSYIHKLINKYNYKNEVIKIDGVHFIDITTLPEEIKKNLKK